MYEILCEKIACLSRDYDIYTVGPGQPNGLVRWTGYRFVVRQLFRCVF